MVAERIYAIFAFALVSAWTPGPNNLMLMNSGVNFGFVATIPHMLGVALGYSLMIVLVGIGLTGLFDSFPLSYVLLKVLSLLLLVYFAWKIATAKAPASEDDSNTQTKPFTFLQAALFQWVNPKGWAMALAAIGTYVPRSAPTSGVLILSSIFLTVGCLTTTTWTYLGRQLRRLLKKPKHLRAFNIASAILLVAAVVPVFLEF